MQYNLETILKRYMQNLVSDFFYRISVNISSNGISFWKLFKKLPQCKTTKSLALTRKYT